MKSKFTIFLSTLLALVSPAFALAAFNDVALNTSGTEISISSVTLTIQGGNGANVEQIVVNADSFVPTMPANSYFKVKSTDRRKFTIDPVGSLKITTTCTDTESTLELDNPADGPSVSPTVGVSSGACAAGGGGGGSGGGSGGSSGGGGGGGGGPAVIAAAPKSVPAQVVAQPSPVAQLVSPVFNTDLVKGSRGDDVKRLQELLKGDKDIYPDGSVTGFYGALTEQAVRKFQAKYGLSQVGRVGPATRAKLQEVFSGATPAVPAPAPATPSSTPAPSVASPSPVAASVSPVFNSNLSVGSSSSDVKRLQQLLNSDPDTRIASSGAGSPGNETNLLGSLTAKAIGKFQLKHGLVTSSSEAGYGNLGPKTRAKLQAVFNYSPAPAVPPAPVVNPVQPVVPPATTAVPTPPAPESVPFWMQLQPSPRAGGASVVDPTSPSSQATIEEKKAYSETLPYWMRLTQ
mgnify:CR=1 FL=1